MSADWWARRRFALRTGAVSIVCSLALSFFGGELVGVHGWLVSNDVWWTTESARWVWYQGLRGVYQANPWYAALPGFLILYAPVAGLASALQLVQGYPFELAHPSMWLLIGPFFALCGAVVPPAVDGLAEAIGAGCKPRKLLALAVALLVVAPTVGIAGHPEDLLALACVCISLKLAWRGRWLEGALVLALAILFQTWAGLALPLYVALAPAGRRLRCALAAGGPPALLGVVLLASDFTNAAISLLGQPMPNSGQKLPWWWVAPDIRVAASGTFLNVVSGSSSRLGAVVVAMLVALWVRGSLDRRSLIAGAAAVFFARGMFETELWPYYLAPAAVFLALGATVVGERRARVGLVICAIGVAWSAPAAYLGLSENPLVWFLATGVLGLLGLGTAWRAIEGSPGVPVLKSPVEIPKTERCATRLESVTAGP